jgi:L-2-hydroxyglutarate oxidase
VLALSREGYRWGDVSTRDLGEILGYPGFWRLARRHARTGVVELARSVSRRAFAAALSRLVPGITAADLVRVPAGVRAQAVGTDGALLDDFVVQAGLRQVHVLNAPSPAATSALEIARHVATRLPRGGTRITASTTASVVGGSWLPPDGWHGGPLMPPFG